MVQYIFTFCVLFGFCNEHHRSGVAIPIILHTQANGTISKCVQVSVKSYCYSAQKKGICFTVHVMMYHGTDGGITACTGVETITTTLYLHI